VQIGLFGTPTGADQVISAGIRNHFALDLGLDRYNPAACLGALTEDGVEQRIDLGIIGDRTFVNNASYGAYAEVVRSPAHRDDKRGTGSPAPGAESDDPDPGLAGPPGALLSGHP